MGRCYIARMNDFQDWTNALKAAERELDTAKTRTALDTAAKKLMRAKEALKRLDEAIGSAAT